MLIDAATFLAAGAVVRIGLADRPRACLAERPAGRRRRGSRADLIDILADLRRRALLVLVWTVGCYVVPEALAAPYAAEVGASTAVVGLLMAADPFGCIAGAWLFGRFVPVARRPMLIGPAAVAAGIRLLLMVWHPSIPLTIAAWSLTGLLSTVYLMRAQASFVRVTQEPVRGRAIGVAGTGIIASQGLAVLGGGLLAELWDPAIAITVSAAVGIALALVGAMAWRRVEGARAVATSAGPSD